MHSNKVFNSYLSTDLLNRINTKYRMDPEQLAILFIGKVHLFCGGTLKNRWQ